MIPTGSLNAKLGSFPAILIIYVCIFGWRYSGCLVYFWFKTIAFWTVTYTYIDHLQTNVHQVSLVEYYFNHWQFEHNMSHIFLLQQPFNRVSYSIIGDDSAPAYFSISEENGEIRVKSSLAADTATSYTVSKLKRFHLILKLSLSSGTKVFHNSSFLLRDN